MTKDFKYAEYHLWSFGFASQTRKRTKTIKTLLSSFPKLKYEKPYHQRTCKTYHILQYLNINNRMINKKYNYKITVLIGDVLASIRSGMHKELSFSILNIFFFFFFVSGDLIDLWGFAQLYSFSLFPLLNKAIFSFFFVFYSS